MKYNEIQNLLSKIVADLQLAQAEVQSITSSALLAKAIALVETAKSNDFEANPLNNT